jgi:hypothetical protein
MASQIRGQEQYARFIPVVILPGFPATSKRHVSASRWLT